MGDGAAAPPTGGGGGERRPGTDQPLGESGTEFTRPVRPGVAAFDFDGTLTHRDVLVPFLMGLGGPWVAARSMGRTGVDLARQRSRSRDDAKTALLRYVMAGRPAAEVMAAGAAYAASLQPRLRSDALERIAWHRARGHLVVLVSASLAVYLRPLAEALGLDGVEAVELVADDQGLLTGAMTGPNCRGPEKVVRLDRHLAAKGLDRSEVELWAYGDSSGDAELLAAAQHAHRCTPMRRRNRRERRPGAAGTSQR